MALHDEVWKFAETLGAKKEKPQNNKEKPQNVVWHDKLDGDAPFFGFSEVQEDKDGGIFTDLCFVFFPLESNPTTSNAEENGGGEEKTPMVISLPMLRRKNGLCV